MLPLLEVDQLQPGMLGVAGLRARRTRLVRDHELCRVVSALIPRATAVDEAARTVRRGGAAGRRDEQDRREDDGNGDAKSSAASRWHGAGTL